MLSYCLRCKDQTETIDPQNIIAKNGRKMIKGTCKMCGAMKSRFIK